MPNVFLKSVSKKTGKSMESLEANWSKAKELAQEQDKSENYGYITSIFKKITGLKESLFDSLCESLIIEHTSADSILKEIKDISNDYKSIVIEETVTAVDLEKRAKSNPLVKGILSKLQILRNEKKFDDEQITNVMLKMELPIGLHLWITGNFSELMKLDYNKPFNK